MEVLDKPDLETIAEVIDDSDINEEIEEWLITKLEINSQCLAQPTQLSLGRRENTRRLVQGAHS